jgi:chemotaxis protein MotB
MSRSRTRSHGHGSSERWLLTYSDLITLLLAFFVMMYSVSNADLEKFRKVSVSMRQLFNPSAVTDQIEQTQQPPQGPPTELLGGSLQEDLVFIRSQLDPFISEQGLEQNVGVKIREEGISIVVSDATFFASGHAELGERAYPILDKVAEVLKALPNEVRVEGHTDEIAPDGSGFATNWDLSAARAVAVVGYLVKGAGLAPERVYAAAYSQYRPLSDNETAEGRMKNRRAEILVIYRGLSGTPGTPRSDE